MKKKKREKKGGNRLKRKNFQIFLPSKYSRVTRDRIFGANMEGVVRVQKIF